MNRSYFVLVVLAVAALCGVFLMTAVDIRAFIDAPSLAVVLLFPVLMSFGSHGPREIGKSYRVAFEVPGATRAELETALAYFEGLGRYLAWGGALGVTVGLVVVLGYAGLGNDVAAVGKGLALCLLSAVYAIALICLVAIPFRAAVRKRLAQLGG